MDPITQLRSAVDAKATYDGFAWADRLWSDHERRGATPPADFPATEEQARVWAAQAFPDEIDYAARAYLTRARSRWQERVKGIA